MARKTVVAMDVGKGRGLIAEVDTTDWQARLLEEAEVEEQAEAAAEDVPVTNQQLMDYAKELQDIEEERAQLTADLKQVEDRRKQLRVQLIPDAMRALGMVNSKGKGVFTFGSSRFHLESKLYASCSEAGKPLLFEYLRERHDEHLIKETVNPTTLSAYIRERRAEGENDPPGVSVHEEVTAKMTKVK